MLSAWLASSSSLGGTDDLVRFYLRHVFAVQCAVPTACYLFHVEPTHARDPALDATRLPDAFLLISYLAARVGRCLVAARV